MSTHERDDVMFWVDWEVLREGQEKACKLSKAATVEDMGTLM